MKGAVYFVCFFLNYMSGAIMSFWIVFDIPVNADGKWSDSVVKLSKRMH